MEDGMAERPKLLITRRWPAAVEAALRDRYDLTVALLRNYAWGIPWANRVL